MPKKARKRITPTLLVLTALGILSRQGSLWAREVSGTVSKAKPHWATDLKPLGFRKFRRGFVNDYGSASSIAFGKESIAVGFDALNKGATNATSAPGLANPQPFRLIVAFLDPNTGRQLAVRSWPAATLDPDMVYTTKGGRFLVQLHETRQGEGVGPSTLILLSQTFEEQKRLQLSLYGGSRGEWWEVHIAPDRSSLLLCHVQDGAEEDQLLDPDSFERDAAWKDVHTGTASSVAGHAIIRKKGLGSDTVYLRGADQTWRALRSFQGHPKLLTEDLIVATGGRSGAIEASRRDGTTVLSEELSIEGHRTRIDPPIVSAGGKRFAAIVNSCVGRSCYGYRRFVFVWDVTKEDPILGLQISTNAPLFPGAALSPDGSLLAVVNGSRLEVYQVPK